jgi:AbrB family looped-hinge helix DNA binding protein
MPISRLSSRGQITLPSAIRKKTGIKPGSKIEIEARDNEVIIRPMRSVMDIAGIFVIPEDKKGMDWNEIISKTEEIVANEVENKGKN